MGSPTRFRPYVPFTVFPNRSARDPERAFVAPEHAS